MSKSSGFRGEHVGRASASVRFALDVLAIVQIFQIFVFFSLVGVREEELMPIFLALGGAGVVQDRSGRQITICKQAFHLHFKSILPHTLLLTLYASPPPHSHPTPMISPPTLAPPTP